MQNTSLQSELARMVDDAGQPHDVYRNHTFPTHLKFTSQEPPQERFYAFLEALLECVAPKQKSHRGTYRAAGEQLLLNLSKAVFSRNWLCIEGDKNKYQGDPNEVFPTFRPIDEWLKFLLSSGLIEKKQGKNYEDNPVLNRYFPTLEIRHKLIEFSPYLESPIHPPYLRMNKPDGSFIDYDWDEDWEKERFLEEFNEFAKNQTWAQKGPIVQVFKNSNKKSGRLHTEFQNLPSRNYEIRINTLINGNPIAEVDFNANHLRLFLAKKGRPYIGGDPYLEIATEANCTREEVKGFVNVALNCESYGQAAGAAMKEWAVSQQASQRIHEALEKIYPNLNFFEGFGLEAMNKEGEILTRIMKKGMSEGIFCIPIHDAIAVEAQHAGWAVEAMQEAWIEEVGDGIWFDPKLSDKKLSTVVKVKLGGEK